MSVRWSTEVPVDNDRVPVSTDDGCLFMVGALGLIFLWWMLETLSEIRHLLENILTALGGAP